jgi:hypothetical protein
MGLRCFRRIDLSSSTKYLAVIHSGAHRVFLINGTATLGVGANAL